MEDSPFLQKLPVEIRLRIYEYLLSFNFPIKLRQVVPGTRDLSILRTCQQIRNEALPVLYDFNTILITRNDFCHYTDSTLQTPLQLRQIRHLRVISFSQSIACSTRDPTWQCDVCQPHAQGFMRALIAMPKLKSVVVDYRRHVSEMQSLVEQFGEELQKRNEMGLGMGIVRFQPMTFRLVGKGLRGLDVVFRCGL